MKITLTKQEAIEKLEEYFRSRVITSLGGELEIEILESLTFEEEVESFCEKDNKVDLPKIATWEGDELSSEESDAICYLKENNRKLFDFLVHKNVLREYIANCNLQGGSSTYHLHDIGMAFSWRASKEGHDFWSNLSREYSSL